jgi:uncharacterized protein (DUF2267 family)
VDYEAFLAAVERDAGTSRELAERAVRATLQTLAERLSGGEAEDVAEQLPQELRPFVRDGNKAEPFDLAEFVRRVAEREGVPPETAKVHARAVFAALGMALTPEELHDLASQLPKDFDALVAAAVEARARMRAWAARAAKVTADEFYERVARRAEVDRDTARRTADAVLEALAYRISGGEVNDLETYLPPELHVPLEAGKAESGGRALKLSLDDFLQRVAEREGVSPADARRHAHAVLETLHEVAQPEFHDVLSELPEDYRTLLAKT